MLSTTALFLVLPVLVAGHPLQQRATAESDVLENESATDASILGSATPTAPAESSGGTEDSTTGASATSAGVGLSSYFVGGGEFPVSETSAVSETTSLADYTAESALASPTDVSQVSTTPTSCSTESVTGQLMT